MHISCMPLYCSLKTALKITAVTFVNVYSSVWSIIVLHHHMINKRCQLMSSVVTYWTNPHFCLLFYIWVHLRFVSNYIIDNFITIFATNGSGLLNNTHGPSEKHISSFLEVWVWLSLCCHFASSEAKWQQSLCIHLFLLIQQLCITYLTFRITGVSVWIVSSNPSNCSSITWAFSD